MRNSKNPAKEKRITNIRSFHRVIIPLYIPNELDYYKDAWEIFKYCLLSLSSTSISTLVISVISNGCCNSVNKKLYDYYERGLLDELIIEKQNIGKINSVLKSIRTANERLITVTDADVLFLNGWEEAVINVFEEFPKAGVVSPVPIFRRHNSLTYNIWYDYLFSKKLRFTKVKNPEALTRFAKSIGWTFLDEKYKDIILTLSGKNNNRAVVGSPHFVATYKREVFEALPKNNSNYKLGGESELKYTDEPVIKCDGYRLATEDNYCFHLGNTLEDWMLEEHAKIKYEEKRDLQPDLKKLSLSPISYLIKSKIFRKIISVRPLLILFLKRKGISKNKIKHFIK